MSCFTQRGKYWNVFFPVIESLSSMGIASVYYSEDENDPGLKHEGALYQSRYIGKGLQSIAVMNKIDVPVVAMTTPQLDVMQLRRSKKVQHYTHILHAPTDALMYRKFAFDYFDSVMCSSNAQIKSIRALEKFRKLPQKALYKTGLTYYDVIAKNLEGTPTKGDKILVAPTWKTGGMLELYGTEPIEKLLDAGEKVIIRPHPQIYVSKPDVVEAIEQMEKKYANLQIDNNRSPIQSMSESKIMISDMSGVIFDYVFMFKKPILLVESMIQSEGYEAEDVNHTVWEFEATKQIAHTLDRSNIEK